MAKIRGDGHRIHFTKIVGTTPVLLCAEDSRWIAVIHNESSATLYIGASGATNVGIAAGETYRDEYSSDEWWAKASSSSGTISGYIVR